MLKKGKRNFQFVLFTLLILLLFFELSLRGLETYFLFQQQQNNAGDGVRILALGESTSSDAMARSGYSWPRHLSAMLEARGIKNKMINKSLPATTTTAILAKLPGYLDQERPQLVISMMGINDPSEFRLKKFGLVSESQKFWSLRIIKFCRGLYWMAVEILRAKPPVIYPDSLNFPNPNQLIQAIQRGSYSEYQASVEDFLKQKEPVQKAQFYTWLGQSVAPPHGEPIEKFNNTYYFLEEALKFSLEIDHLLEFYVFLAEKLRDKNKCEMIARRVLSEGKVASDIFVQRVGYCLGTDHALLPDLLKSAGDQFRFDFNSKTTVTQENYQSLYKTLRESGVCWIVVQYPTRSIEPLKDYFREVNREFEKEPRIRFVSNEENFEVAMQNSSYEKFFYDRFAGTFGHATDLGNKMIAENVVSTAEELIRSGLCKSW